MNEMASQVCAVSQLEILRGYHCHAYMYLDSCHERNAGVKIYRTN